LIPDGKGYGIIELPFFFCTIGQGVGRKTGIGGGSYMAGGPTLEEAVQLLEPAVEVG